MYADKVTKSMQITLDETNRRREKQVQYNLEHGITPLTVGKSREAIIEQTSVADFKSGTAKAYAGPDDNSIAADPIVQYMSKKQLQDAINSAKKNMDKAAKAMDFLDAAKFRDEMYALEKVLEGKE